MINDVVDVVAIDVVDVVDFAGIISKFVVDVIIVYSGRFW